MIGDRLAAPSYLLISRQAIQFNPAASAWIDVVSFTELLGLADLTALEQAAELYRGDLLEGFSLSDAPLFEEWALLNRERYRRLVVDALGRLAERYGERGAYERALPHAWRQVELDPWRETAHQQLMRLLALSGRRTDALIQYETCCRLLAEELGVAPAETTVALYERIRSGQLAAPERTPLPVRVPAVEAPPLSTRTNRPAQRASVCCARGGAGPAGRCLDLAMAGQGRVFFLRGEAGSGKTALMAEFARRAMEADHDLIVAGGECSAYSGLGDPYLPFRGILAMLTGDLQTQWAGGALSRGMLGVCWVPCRRRSRPCSRWPPGAGPLSAARASSFSRLSGCAGGEPWLQRLRQRLEQSQIRRNTWTRASSSSRPPTSCATLSERIHCCSSSMTCSGLIPPP